MSDTYPGSKVPVNQYDDPQTARKVERDPGTPLVLGQGRPYKIGGKATTLYTIGSFAQALNRVPQTLRLWEREGIIPGATYHDPRRRGLGKERLYSREQIEAAVDIAHEEGILADTWKPIPRTFTERVTVAWKELAG